MVAKEINPNKLVDGLAAVLKKEGMVSPPQWAGFVKTGVHAERPPQDPDWWYVRSASLLRQVYMRGPIGVGKLRNWYGGRKKRGSRPERHRRAGGKIIRTCLQQLEGAGLIVKEGSGRKISAKGQSLIDKTASSLRPKATAKKPQPKEEAKAKKPAAKKPQPKEEAKAKKPAAKKPQPKEEAKAKKPAAKKPKAREGAKA